jgi:undecaprenyl-diphosphatase
MPYPRFLAWNVLGALIWAPSTVLAGYAAGSSYRRVERFVGAAGVILLAVLVAVTTVVVMARWIARHPEEVRRLAAKQLDRPRVVRLSRRYRSQLDFLGARFRPGNALGLVLTAQLTVLVAAGWAFGALFQDVVGVDGAVGIDLPVERYLAAHRTGWLTTTMRDVTWSGSAAVLIPLVVVVGIAARLRTRRWAVFAELVLSIGGVVVLSNLIKALVARPRPQVGHLVASASGYGFPSGHTSQVTAVAVTGAVLASAATTSWPRKVTIWSIAALACLFVGLSRAYLGVHWPTDVLAGYALGALWAAVCALAVRGRTGRAAPPFAPA